LRCLARDGREGFDVLRWALNNDEDALVRTEAAALLMRQGDPSGQAEEQLRRALVEGCADLQVRAAEIIGDSGEVTFIDALQETCALFEDEGQEPSTVIALNTRRELRKKVRVAVEAALAKLRN
jgi:hypothetical protein